MNESTSAPALSPSSSRAVTPWTEDPAVSLEAYCRRLLAAGAVDPAACNGTLQIAAVGFARHAGDWLGVVVTPWCLDLFLLPGGGSLWGDIPAGQRRYVTLPGGTLPFTAVDDLELGPYQHTPLIAPVTALPDMATALRLAREAVATLHGVAAALPSATSATASPGASGGMPPEEAAPGRRAFFRRLAGRR